MFGLCKLYLVYTVRNSSAKNLLIYSKLSKSKYFIWIYCHYSSFFPSLAHLSKVESSLLCHWILFWKRCMHFFKEKNSACYWYIELCCKDKHSRSILSFLSGQWFQIILHVNLTSFADNLSQTFGTKYRLNSIDNYFALRTMRLLLHLDSLVWHILLTLCVQNKVLNKSFQSHVLR